MMTALIFGLLWFVRYLLQNGSAALKNCYQGIEVHSELRQGDVELVFHTYHGLLGGGFQTKHHVFVPSEQAELLLTRLHRFNLKWGCLSPGAFFVPFLSYANYCSQRKTMRAKLAARNRCPAAE